MKAFTDDTWTRIYHVDNGEETIWYANEKEITRIPHIKTQNTPQSNLLYYIALIMTLAGNGLLIYMMIK